ncbi:MAG TPA: hypothetical protein V6D21_05805 [Candidatus Obscuribacterales bacterium]
MGRRFYHQQRAQQYLNEKAIIDSWMDKTVSEKQTAYEATVSVTGNKKSNVGQEPGYIIPFGYSQADDIWLKVGLVKEGSNTAPSEESAAPMIGHLRTAVLDAANKFAQTAAPATGAFVTDVARKKIELPRVRLVKPAAAPLANKVTSRITGRKYTYTKKDSVSCPFGQKIGAAAGAAGTTFENATPLLVAALRTLDPDYKIYTSPQGKLPISKV